MIDFSKNDYFIDFQDNIKSSIYWRITSYIVPASKTSHLIILRLEDLINVPPDEREQPIKELLSEGMK